MSVTILATVAGPETPEVEVRPNGEPHDATHGAQGFAHGRVAAPVGAERGHTIVVDDGTNGIDDAIVGDVASDEMMGMTEAIKPGPEDGEPMVGFCLRNAPRPWQRQRRRGHRHPLTRSNKQGMERIDG